MRKSFGAAAVVAAFFAWGCGSNGTSPTTSGSGGAKGTGGAASQCPLCVTDADCQAGNRCAQFAGDSYCAPSCAEMQACSADRACTPVPDVDGTQLQVCVPRTDVCGSDVGSSSSSGGGSGSQVCGSLHAPGSPSCCTSCDPGEDCQPNGCYAGWWCNADTCKCQAPPADMDCADPGDAGIDDAGAPDDDAGTTAGSITSVAGGTLDTLSFAIVGDTRPPTPDDTAGYPAALITKIYKDIEQTSPRPAFAVTTGDYVFAKPGNHQAAPQLDKYLTARGEFSNGVFYSLGNHECTGAVTSNCGSGNASGLTNNYKAFLNKLITPLGLSEPYYAVHVKATDKSWTAKFVFVAANAWSSAQSSWLKTELGKSTTYTFIMRHEGKGVTDAPGVTPSNTIIANHPYTLLIVGHAHSYGLQKGNRSVLVGNGGAPLTGNVNYGYVIARQRDDGAIVFREHDYSTKAVKDTFVVRANGTFTQ